MREAPAEVRLGGRGVPEGDVSLRQAQMVLQNVGASRGELLEEVEAGLGVAVPEQGAGRDHVERAEEPGRGAVAKARVELTAPAREALDGRHEVGREQSLLLHEPARHDRPRVGRGHGVLVMPPHHGVGVLAVGGHVFAAPEMLKMMRLFMEKHLLGAQADVHDIEVQVK